MTNDYKNNKQLKQGLKLAAARRKKLYSYVYNPSYYSWPRMMEKIIEYYIFII